MQKTVLGALATAALFSFCLSTAHAAPADPLAAADSQAASPAVQITAKSKQHSHTVLPSEFENFSGAYRLNNQQVLTASQNNRHFYVQLNNQPKQEIFAFGPNSFVTQAGAVITFRDNGETVALGAAERLGLASR